MSSSYVILERIVIMIMYFVKAGHRVRKVQKRIFLQNRDMSSPAVDPAASAVAVAAAGWATA